MTVRKGIVGGHRGGYEDGEDVEVDCEIKSDNPEKGSIAIWDGSYTHAGGLKQEKWTWVPRSLCEIRTDRKAISVKRWFAEKNGLV